MVKCSEVLQCIDGLSNKVSNVMENMKLLLICILLLLLHSFMGHAVAQLVEALRYNPEGRGFDSRWYHWIFSLT